MAVDIERFAATDVCNRRRRSRVHPVADRAVTKPRAVHAASGREVPSGSRDAEPMRVKCVCAPSAGLTVDFRGLGVYQVPLWVPWPSISSGSQRRTCANAGDVAERTRMLTVRDQARAVRGVGREVPSDRGTRTDASQVRVCPSAGLTVDFRGWVSGFLSCADGQKWRADDIQVRRG